MPRRTVALEPGVHYHLYNRGNNRERIFFEPANYLFFLQRLWMHLVPGVDVVAYCLMPTHYHLLALLNDESLSHHMQLLSISYTKAVNSSYDRVGSLFQGAFKAKRVETDEYLVHLSRYIHVNPVIGGLVGQPEEWEYSSYREYIGLRRGTQLKPEIVLSQFKTVSAYRQFVEAYTDQELERIRGLVLE